MAALTDSAAIEKSSAFEDVACDPDLEARLYAEIYYSNETYQQDPPSRIESSQNPETSVPSAGEVGEFLSNRENIQLASTNSAAGPLEQTSADSEVIYPSTRWVLGEDRRDTSRHFPQKSLGPKHPKRQRLLAHEGLWRQSVQPQVRRAFNEAATQNSKDTANEGRTIESENFASAPNRSKEAEYSESTINRFANNHTIFGGSLIESRNITPGANWFEEAANAIGPFTDGLTVTGSFTSHVNQSRDSRIAPARFGGHLTQGNARKIPSIINRFEDTRTHSTPFIDHSSGVGKFAKGSNRVRNVFGRNERNLIEVQTLGARLAGLNESGNTYPQSTSNLNEIEAFTPIVAGSSKARSVFGRFENGLANVSENAALTDESVTQDYSQLIEDSSGESRSKAKRNRRLKKVLWRQFLAEKKMRKKARKGMDTAGDAAASNDSSKYKVVSKETKLKTKEATPEPVSISSDSDDSILEVPVPPKAPPPLIQLQDSDDEVEVSKSCKSPSKRGKKLVEEPANIETESSEDEAIRDDRDNGNSDKSRTKKIDETAKIVDSLGDSAESSKNDQSPASPVRETCPADLQNILRESAKKLKNSETPRRKKSAESAEKPTESATSFRNDESPAATIASGSPTNSQRILRESAKKPRNSETPKKSKKSTGLMEKSADPVEISAESSDSFRKDQLPTTPTASGSQTNLQKILRESAKKLRCSETPKRSKKIAESAEKTAESVEKSTESAEKTIGTFRNDESPASPIDNDSPTNLQEILRESAKRAKSATVPVNMPDDNLILNCTEIQRGASSLNEIRMMRETVTSNHTYSDDNMTENEASNWANIEAGQSNASRTEAKISPIDLSDDTTTNLWEQLSPENRPTSFANVPAGASDVNLPIRTIALTGENCNNDTANSDVGHTRKRSKDTTSSTFDDFDVPAIPEKRAKQSKQKTSREQTMTEYFFKPMSKELVAFYNNPCGGENLDVCDVQSRMPRNPNRWAILDADLQGPVSRRRRKMCPRCKSEAHFGKKCTEKPKAPCCYMCGASGHTESRCPHTMCLTCGRKYATYRPTCDHCSKLYCSMCNGAGHSCENCPDLWRRYHNTTTEVMPVTPRDTANVMKPTHNLSCCNCARRGHDMTTCRQLRWTQHFPTSMRVTNYTEGPTYPPTNRIIFNETSETPQRRQYYDVDADSLPIHERSQDQNLTNSNYNEIIEIIEVLDDSTSSEPAIPPLLPASRVIFEAGELNREKTCKWAREMKHLDPTKGIELTGLLSGSLSPAFLLDWQNYFEFHVTIVQESNGGIFITIRHPKPSILTRLERVIWQWLERSDIEKAYLAYDKLPYDNIAVMNEELQTKIALTRTVLKPIMLLKKINAGDKSLCQIQGKLKHTLSKKNRRRLTALKLTAVTTMNRRSQLITSLYSGLWVETKDQSLHIFRQLAGDFIKQMYIGEQINPRNYLLLVHVYNEVFAFHETEALKKALAKAVATALRSEIQEALPPSEALVFPKAELPVNMDLIRESGSAKARCSLSVEKAVSGTSASSETVANRSADTLEGSLHIIATSSNAAAPDQAAANEPRVLNESCTHDGDKLHAHGGKMSQRAQQQQKATEYMSNFTKKQRKIYLRTARQLIRVALLSDVAKLKEMAKIVRNKCDHCTASTSDLEWLQNAIQENLGSRKDANCGRNSAGGLKKFKGTVNIRQDDERERCDQAHDPTYVKFLRTL